jgi:hypothetical protein
MIHVFLLVVYLGVGEQRTLISNDMFFRDLNECNWYAKEITKRYGNYRYIDRMDPRDRVTAYCLPKYLKEDSIRIY